MLYYIHEKTFYSSLLKMGVKTGHTQERPERSLDEVAAGNYDASLGGYIYKKRIRFEGRGKSGSARTIICFKRNRIAIYLHGFAKNEKDNLSAKELNGFKELSKIIANLNEEDINKAIANGDFKEVHP